MRRRDLLRTGAGAAAVSAGLRAGQRPLDCGCSLQVQAAAPGPFERVGSRLRVTGMKVYRRVAKPDIRPALRLLQARNQPGLVGWGEGTLEGKAGADDGLHQRLPRVRHRRRPDAGRAHLAIDVRAQFLPRGTGDGLGDFRQSTRRCGTFAARRSACLYTSCWAARSIRVAFAATITPTACARRKHYRLRETAIQQGVSCFKTGLPTYYEWIETPAKIAAP